jgi:hypothetical protein
MVPVVGTGLPFTGAAVVPGRPPEHGRPVSGFVPVVVLVRTPPDVLGSAGETGFSGVAGKSWLLVLGEGSGLRVIPFSSVVAGFCCVSATVLVAVRTRTLRPISPM